MSPEQIREQTLADDVARALDAGDLTAASTILAGAPTDETVAALERLDRRRRAVAFRLLAKDRALAVFEDLSPALQGDLVRGLQDADVAAIFAGLDPDDRVWLLDELPAGLASRLLRDLPPAERRLTAGVLGYPKGSIGRRMSPEVLAVRPDQSAAEALARVRHRIHEAENVYTLPVLDDGRRVVGVVSLRDLLAADDAAPVAGLMRAARTAPADADAEAAARRCTDLHLLALPIVDHEQRLVGIITVDDAVRILERAEDEDAARQGGAEPLRRPYLATPLGAVVRSRVVWLLVLALGATLTVQVLAAFEATIAQVTALALFVPLLIGTGGNTGNQAATTVTRAIALDDVRPRDLWRVLGREVRVGLALGGLLGAAGFAVTAVAFDARLGVVIGLTLAAVCTMAAAVGGVMPLVARRIGVDPAVFSNPFITTFVDAAGLVVYFLVARAVLGV